MRVALLSLYLPGSSKIGVGHQVHGLANALVDRGHDVTVLSPDEPGEGATYRWQAVAGGPPARLVRVPVGREKARMALIGATEGLASMTADRTVAISDATRRMAPWAGRVIPCGVDVAAFDGVPRADTEHPTILFVGTFANRKRGRLLWEAFGEVVRPALPDAELWMVCDDAPPVPGVRVLGRLSPRELVEAYRSAWVFCLPSSYEGFGVPYAEALAAGTPVVATPNPGALEVLEDGRLGELVDPGDLGPALVRLLGDPQRRATLAAVGRGAAVCYDWSSVATAYEQVYAEAIMSPTAHRPPPTAVAPVGMR